MPGKIIDFRNYELRRTSLYRKQPSPRGPDRQAALDLQIARISALLEELEDLTRSADGSPSPLLLRARSTINRASRILAPHAGPEKSDEADPQPDVDRALLERLYSDLNPYA